VELFEMGTVCRQDAHRSFLKSNPPQQKSFLPHSNLQKEGIRPDRFLFAKLEKNRRN